MISASTRGSDEHVDRVEPHHAERVDLLAHLHRAELGGDGAAGAAGDHDGGQERRQLAQRQDADEVDGEDAGAEDSGAGRRPAAR